MRQPLYLKPTALDLAWKSPGENLRRIENTVKAGLEASSSDKSEEHLFIFPELTLTGFVTTEPEAYSLDPAHDYIGRLKKIALQYRTALAAGFPEKNPDAPGKPFNTLVLIDPNGEVVSRYRKMHLFTLGKKPESESYSAGAAGTVCEYRGWKIGLAICFDVRFPRLFHSYAQKSVDILLISACWVGGPHKTYQYRTLCSGHAISTMAYVAAVNRSGKDPAFEYDGAEYVFSPYGEQAYDQTPCLVDEAELENCRKLVVRPSDRAEYPICS